MKKRVAKGLELGVELMKELQKANEKFDIERSGKHMCDHMIPLLSGPNSCVLCDTKMNFCFRCRFVMTKIKRTNSCYRKDFKEIIISMTSVPLIKIY